MSCQLMSIDHIAKKNSCLNDLLQLRVKTLRNGKRKFFFFVKRTLSFLKLRKISLTGRIYENQDINEGDIVKVRRTVAGGQREFPVRDRLGKGGRGPRVPVERVAPQQVPGGVGPSENSSAGRRH